jgi:hypothetical protein
LVVTPGLLRAAGEAAFGPNWLNPLAKALTPHHPKGRTVSAVVVRRWSLGDRTIPSWLPKALWIVVDYEASRFPLRIAQLEERRVMLHEIACIIVDKGYPLSASGELDDTKTEDEN